MNINYKQLEGLGFYIESAAQDIELEVVEGNLRVRVEYPASVDNFILDKEGLIEEVE